MRVRTIALGLAMLLAACGAETLPGEADRTPPLAAAAPTTAGAPAAPAYLDPEDALLTEIGSLVPWRETHRTGVAAGYESGPNQTDCAAFSAFDDLTAVPAARAGWWRDGFNLNHNVYEYDTAAAAAAALAAVGRIVEACPRVTWLEGGAFDIAALPLPGTALGFEFIDDTGEVHWYALLQRANILSRIEILSFGDEPLQRTTDLAEFQELVSTAARLLDDAPAVSEPPGTTTSAPPPPTSPPATPAQITEVDRSLFAPLLLGEGDIDATLVSRSRSHGGESSIDDCPAADAFVRLADWMQIEAEFESSTRQWSATHAVGFPDDGTDPLEAVEAVAAIGACDFGEPALQVVGGPIEDLPDGAAAGSYFALWDGDVGVVVGLIAMEDGVVTLFSQSGAGSAALTDLGGLIKGFASRLPDFRDHVEACTRAKLLFQTGENRPGIEILERCDGFDQYIVHQAS